MPVEVQAGIPVKMPGTPEDWEAVGRDFRVVEDAIQQATNTYAAMTEEERREEIARIERSYRIIDPQAPPLFPPTMDEPEHVQNVRRRAREYRTVRRVAGQYAAGDWLLAAALVAVLVGLVGVIWGGWR